MSRHIDKGNGFLKDKFGDFQADPPPEVWDAISSQLGGRRRRGMTIIILSAAASLALAVTLGIHYFGKDIPHEIELAEDQESSLPTGSPEEELASAKKDEVSSHTLQEAGLEQKVVEAMAEAMPAIRSNELSLAMSEDLPESDVESEEGLKTEEDIKVGEVLVAEEDLKAGENAGDENAVNLILDAGEVGDVEVMSDVVTMKDKDPRWVLGAMLSPLYSFRDAEPEALAGTSGQESGMISYATGVQVGYRATRRLAFESGIIYNKMGLSIGAPGIQVFANDMDQVNGAPEMGTPTITAITNSVGNIVSHSGEIYVNNYKLNASSENGWVDQAIAEVNNADQGIRQHLDYLELPFNLRYTILEGSFKIQVVGGMSTNLLVNNYVTMETASGTTEIGYLTNLRSVNYSGNAGVGFVYHLLEQLSLNVEPRFRYYLNSVNDATLPSTRPFTFGIYTGLNYFF